MAELQQFANFESIEKQMEYIPHTKFDKFKMCCKKWTVTVIFTLGFGAILFAVISLQVDSKIRLMNQETREKLNASVFKHCAHTCSSTPDDIEQPHRMDDFSTP